MEGSARRRRRVDQSDPKVIFGNAGLPQKPGAAWMNARLSFSAQFQARCRGGAKFWRSGADLLSKLPKKPKRNAAQQSAADIILSHAATRASSSSPAMPTRSIAS